ncbi:uncharacterized protein LOC126886176 [Diabrotica virgifera virgifera]|uniref:Craniofacial development protein 2-like n=1 Tax=Diabrotica virgifera virgifera TaxID=50390 RepID=A0ABM5KFL9_DIAVI|nr:uncharacterized protein LOC126886176 [Diabrotica virgifera virgifera]
MANSLSARTFSVSNLQLRTRLTPIKSELGLPLRGRKGPKKLVLTIAMLNVRSMTGKGRELVEFIEIRTIGVLYQQETCWKGNKSRDLEDGCKLLWSRNGVGIILNNWKEGFL